MIVSFKNQGRLGNYLFEAGAALAYSLEHNLDFTIPNPKLSNFWNPIYFPHLYKRTAPLLHIKLYEQSHGYNPIPFEEHYRGKMIVLHGYWQSEKYFVKYRKEVLQAFNLPWKMDKGLVAIHVRRGDYLQYAQKHIVLTKAWIEKAKEQFPGYRFKFFSDDIAWCKQNFPDDWHSDNTDPMEDLIQASCCEHQICSPSTMAWWMAWLNQNPNKKVVITDKWFGPGEKLFTGDVVPDSWTKLEI